MSVCVSYKLEIWGSRGFLLTLVFVVVISIWGGLGYDHNAESRGGEIMPYGEKQSEKL